eukprot:431952_1
MSFWFILIIKILYVSCSQNWFCNNSLWTTSQGDTAWTFDLEDGCSVTSSNTVQASVLWIGDGALNESLKWRNYRITATVTLLEGEDVGIIVRANTDLPFVSQGKKYIFPIYASRIGQYKSKTTAFAVNYVEYFDDDYFYQKEVNVILDVYENRFILFVNGGFVFEYFDNCDPIYFGSIGLRTYSATAMFSYFNIDLNASYITSQEYNVLNRHQQYGLKQIYNTMNGKHWINQWNITQIETDEACTSLCGIVCEIKGNQTNIVSLSLSGNNLTGTITHDLIFLNKLRSLDLAGNNLFGSLPDIFDHFEDFQSLSASNNQFNGTLPDSLQTVENLVWFVVSGTNLTGDVNSLFKHNKLNMLFLQNNSFYGTLSDAICNLNQLSEINVADNRLKGSIPVCIGNWSRVQIVHFSSNDLSGSIPQSICNLQSLSKLDLAELKLTGSIPKCICNMTNLWELLLFGNELTSSIPAEICKLTKLKVLVLSENRFIGSIPSCIWSDLPYLQQILLNNNSLTDIEINDYP